ncbi:hypothetical protein ACJQWK_01258 [Exserohilum turcicum]
MPGHPLLYMTGDMPYVHITRDMPLHPYCDDDVQDDALAHHAKTNPTCMITTHYHYTALLHRPLPMLSLPAPSRRPQCNRITRGQLPSIHRPSRRTIVSRPCPPPLQQPRRTRTPRLQPRSWRTTGKLQAPCTRQIASHNPQ